MLFFLGISTGGNVRRELAHDPGSEFTTDMRGFLKTYYLMKSGSNFQTAYEKGMKIAFASDFRVDLAGWREPLIFYIWTFLPGNGTSIYYLALLLFCINLVCAYLISRNFLSAANSLIAPFILLPYFRLPLTDLSILQIEWWALSFLLIGLVLYFRKKYMAAGIFFALTLGAREMFFVPILFLLTIAVLTKEYQALISMMTALSIFVIYYLFFHLFPLLKYGSDLVRGFNIGNIRILRVTFAYSSWNYYFGVFRPIMVLFFIATVLFAGGLFKPKTRLAAANFLSLYLPTFLLLALVAFLGRMTQWHDYWGIYYAPLLLISCPIAIKLLTDSD